MSVFLDAPKHCLFFPETNGAFCEDDWLYIKINGVIFRPTKLCTRCIYTTVDPDLGIKDPNGEPLKTLKTFR